MDPAAIVGKKVDRRIELRSREIQTVSTVRHIVQSFSRAAELGDLIGGEGGIRTRGTR